MTSSGVVTTSESLRQDPSTARSRALHIGALILMAAFAVAICLHYGRFGILPLDNAIVFDGGWRILSGQHPFTDFTTPVGVTPIVMQAVFFRIFGVSWFTYCLHAAVVNALFAWVAFAIMRTVGARFVPAWMVGIASAVMFYPPVGVPYLDQHSFFFSLCCVLAAAHLVTGSRHRPAATFWTPTLGALAFLSKQIPAAFIAGPALLVVAVASYRSRKALFAAGLALPLLAVPLYMLSVHAPIGETYYYLFALPSRSGLERSVVGPRLLQLQRGAHGLPLLTWQISHLLWIGSVLMAIVSRWLRPAQRINWKALALCLVAAGLAAATVAFLAFTNNDLVGALGLVPVIVGFIWVALVSLIRTESPRLLRAATTVAGAALVVTGAIDVYAFNRNVNATRQMHAVFDWSLPRWSPGGRLAYMTLNDRSHLFDIRDALRYIESRPDNFLLWGDSTFLYGATNHPSVFPALWMHPGLTIPPPDTPEFRAFDRKIVLRIRENDVTYILQEGSRTRMDANLDDFPRVSALIAGCARSTAGAWTIREICH